MQGEYRKVLPKGTTVCNILLAAITRELPKRGSQLSKVKLVRIEGADL